MLIAKTGLAPQALTDFQYYYSDRLINKFATNSYLNIPPSLKH